MKEMHSLYDFIWEESCTSNYGLSPNIVFLTDNIDAAICAMEIDD